MGKQHLGLKILVIGMGILIIIGTGVVAYTIISRLAAGGKEAATQKAVEVPAKPETVQRSNRKPRKLKPFGNVIAHIPKDAVIEEMTTDRRRLILRLRLASGEQSVHVFNLRTGEKLGVVQLQAE
jgi:hypothetical protein